MQAPDWLGAVTPPVDGIALIERIGVLPQGCGLEMRGRLSSGRAVRLRVELPRERVARIRFALDSDDSPGERTDTWLSGASLRPWMGDRGEPTAAPGRVQLFDAPSGEHCVTSRGLRVTVHGDPFQLQIQEDATRTLLFKASSDDLDVMLHTRVPAFGLVPSEAGAAAEQAVMGFSVAPDEAFYGLGEQFGPLNLRGRRVQLLNLDAMGVGTDAVYKNVPFVLSSRGYGLFWNTYARTVHDVAYPHTSLYSYRVASDEPELDLWFFYGPTPGQVLRRYTELTGRPAVPPLWTFGLWLSRCWYDTQEEVEQVAAQLKEEELPADVLVLDGRAWLDLRTRCDFRFDRRRYPEPEGLIEELRALGVRVCLWEYPYVSVESPLFNEAASRGYLLKDRSGTPYVVHFPAAAFSQYLTAFPDSGIIDFTQPEAVQWYQGLHRPLFEMGVSVFKTDFGEQVPLDAVASNGLTGTSLHNAYTVLYNEVVYEATRAATGEPVVWARSGWAGSQRFPIHWGGDPPATWDGLAASIRGGLALGLCGFPFWSHDIGGFYGPQPSTELYARWLQFGIFSPFARLHGTTPREPWHYGDQGVALYRKYAQIRYRLVPYLLTAAWESSRSGEPMMRALILEAPLDPVARHEDLEYLLGPDLLVVPVTQPGGGWRAYLPRGTWIDVWEGEVYRGPRHVDGVAPLDRIPVFARGEALIPLGPGPSGPGIPHLPDDAWLPRVLEYFADPHQSTGRAAASAWGPRPAGASQTAGTEASPYGLEPARYHLAREGGALSLWHEGAAPWIGWLRWHGLDVREVEGVVVDGCPVLRMAPVDPESPEGAATEVLARGGGWYPQGDAISVAVRLGPDAAVTQVELVLAER